MPSTAVGEGDVVADAAPLGGADDGATDVDGPGVIAAEAVADADATAIGFDALSDVGEAATPT